MINYESVSVTVFIFKIRLLRKEKQEIGYHREERDIKIHLKNVQVTYNVQTRKKNRKRFRKNGKSYVPKTEEIWLINTIKMKQFKNI